MHLKIDNQNLIQDIHLERWDIKALGKKIIDKVISFKGKDLKNFLEFALTEKLFFKTKILYAIFSNYVLYFWASSPCYGQQHVKDLENITKMFPVEKERFAEIRLKTDEDDEIKSKIILIDKTLASIYKNYGSKKEIIDLCIDQEKSKQICFDFNLVRNGQNLVDVMLIKNGVENNFVAEAAGDIKFIALNNSDETLEIVDGDKLKNATTEDISKYANIYPVRRSKDREDKFKEIIEHINEIKPKKYE